MATQVTCHQPQVTTMQAMNTTHSQPPRNTPSVLIAGAGPAGCAAALAAARCGVQTILVEYHPVLGGMGTAGLVNNFCPAHHDRKRFIIGGVFGEVRQRLIERGALYETKNMEPYEPVAYDQVLKELLDEAGVERRHGHRISAMREVGDQLVTTLDDGSEIITDGAVDATGDAIICGMAGVERVLGREGDQAVMPVTMCYRLSGIDLDAAGAGWPSSVDERNGHTRPIYTDPNTGERNFYHTGYSEFIDPMIVADREAGLLSIPRDHVAVIHGVPGCPGDATVNYGRVFLDDPTDPEQFARARKEAEAQVHDGLAFFRRRLPGFENVKLVDMAMTLGVRQSYQIVGLHRLTAQECLDCTQFDDVVVQGRYMIDIHEPGSDKSTCITLPPYKHYDIPLALLSPGPRPQTTRRRRPLHLSRSRRHGQLPRPTRLPWPLVKQPVLVWPLPLNKAAALPSFPPARCSNAYATPAVS